MAPAATTLRVCCSPSTSPTMARACTTTTGAASGATRAATDASGSTTPTAPGYGTGRTSAHPSSFTTEIYDSPHAILAQRSTLRELDRLLEVAKVGVAHQHRGDALLREREAQRKLHRA